MTRSRVGDRPGWRPRIRARRRVAGVVLLVTLVAPRGWAGEADPWFGSDKALHLGAASAIGAGGYAAGAAVFDRTTPRVLSGMTAAVTVGAAKEWHDHLAGGQASWRDMAWNGVGAAVGVTIAWLVDRAWHHAARARAVPVSSSVPSPTPPSR